MALNKHKSPDRDEFLPEELRIANVNVAHFCNCCIITENRGNVENQEVEKLPLQKRGDRHIWCQFLTKC